MTNVPQRNREVGVAFLAQNLQHTQHERDLIKTALDDRFARIPQEFWANYLDFHKKNHAHFLYQINLLALLAFWSFGLADYFVLTDIGLLSLGIRTILVISFFVITSLIFHYCKKIEWLDLYLPCTTIIATCIWFFILTQSNSPDVITFQYASVIFIVLANVGVQIRFIPSLLPSILISLATCVGVYFASKGSTHELFIFCFAYFPIVLFSLYIGWNSTYKNRQTFLNTLLDENNRKYLDLMAHTDALTSLHNRRYFEQLAEQHLTLARSTRYPVCLLLFDVDHFKKINDNYGHDIGDEMLKLIGEVTSKHTRPDDLLARFGGEEFIMLLPNTDQRQAQKIAERIREEICQHAFKIGDDKVIHTSISIGFANFLPYCHDLRSLIKCADLALYTAKQQGRNRVVMHHNPT